VFYKDEVPLSFLKTKRRLRTPTPLVYSNIVAIHAESSNVVMPYSLSDIFDI